MRLWHVLYYCYYSNTFLEKVWLFSVTPFGKVHLLGTLSGPSFAKELKAGLPTNVVVASDKHKLCKSIRDNFHQKTFRVYESNDVIGVEVAGALKNVVAMVAGAVDGLEMGMNGRAAVVTRGFGEIAKIGVKMGAKPVTFLGLSGLGDLMLTCTGSLSRNRTFGYRLAKGEKPKDIMESMGQVVEGVFTVQSAHKLAEKLNVEAPIIKTAYEVIQGSLSIENAIAVLMSRESKFEFDWSLAQ